MKPKEKGDLAVAHAIFFFQTHDYEVCLPIGDKKPYDLVVEIEGKLQKVQVKYGGCYGHSGKCCVALRTMGGNQTYYTARKYKKDDFDLLFAYTATGKGYLVPWDYIANRSQIVIEASIYDKYRVE